MSMRKKCRNTDQRKTSYFDTSRDIKNGKETSI